MYGHGVAFSHPDFDSIYRFVYTPHRMKDSTAAVLCLVCYLQQLHTNVLRSLEIFCSARYNGCVSIINANNN